MISIHKSTAEQQESPKGGSELMSTKELAAELCLAESTVRRLADMGKIPGTLRLGRTLRYRRTIIQKWVETNCAASLNVPKKGR